MFEVIRIMVFHTFLTIFIYKPLGPPFLNVWILIKSHKLFNFKAMTSKTSSFWHDNPGIEFVYGSKKSNANKDETEKNDYINQKIR